MKSAALQVSIAEDPEISQAPDFNRIAGLYRWMEWLTFGPFLQRTRRSFLSVLRQHRRALVLGDGDGRFTASLISSNRQICVDAVDASDAMLHQLAARSSSPRVRTHSADARTFQPMRRDYDLIATHFFLDCLSTEEIEDLAGRLRDHVEPEATWVVSEFAIPSNSYGRLIARPLISVLYLAFGLLTRLQIRTLPDHRQALAQSGWRLVQQRKSLAGLLVSELWRVDKLGAARRIILSKT
jgi:hypothetical protein